MPILYRIAIFSAAYLIGSIPFAYLLGKCKNINLKKTGTTNPGASNLMVNAGIAIGLAAGILDAGKGIVAYRIAVYLGFATPGQILASAGAVCGHCWNIWLGGKGGRGVATAGGILLLLYPAAGIGVISLMVVLSLLNMKGIYSLLGIPAGGALGTFLGTCGYLIAAYITQARKALTFGLVLFAIIIVRRTTENLQEYKKNNWLQIFCSRLLYDRPTFRRDPYINEKRWQQRHTK